jgi:hypothetical protein
MNLDITVRRVIAVTNLSVVLLLSTGSASWAGNFRQNHPRRAEVLHRDRNINNRLNADKGSLGGHYGQLKREDQSVRRQEQRDARINGGFITKGQKAHLNQEENHINNQIRRDHN